jgi:hypothetical protein
MSRLQRFLAHPHKLEAIEARLLGSWRRRKLTRHGAAVLPGPFGTPRDAARHLRTRQRPAFFFEVGRIPAIIAGIPPQDKNRLHSEARQFLARTFSFRSAPPATFARVVDWEHRAHEDPDWNADLHRLDWIVTLLLAAHHDHGDPRWSESAADGFTQWWQANPPGTRAWSDPFEVAQRSNTLSWILCLGAALDRFPERALHAALEASIASARWTAALLEYHVPNNHLLIEAFRLAQSGLLLPEFPEAAEWLKTGLRVVEREVTTQVLPDGVHAERSVFYQRMVLESFIELLALAARNDVPLPAVLAERARKMVEFLIAIRRPDGEFPLLGDGFRSDCLLRYNLLAAGARLLGTAGTGEPPDTRTLWLLNGDWPKPSEPPAPGARSREAGGYIIFTREGRLGLHYLAFDCGPFGIAAASGHGHADCLSLELCVHGQPCLVDSGSYSWRLDERWRRAFRSTLAHNTVMIDRQDQTPLVGRYDCGRFARPMLRKMIGGDSLRLIDASHDGYARLPGNITHRRMVIELLADGWLIVDSLMGSGRHQADVLWHFHPAVSTRLTEQALVARQPAGGGLELTWGPAAPWAPRLYRGQDRPPIGWVSSEAGHREPADVLALGAGVDCPSWVACLLSPFTDEPRQSKLEAFSSGHGFAVTCRAEDAKTTVLLSSGQGQAHRFGEWATDAEILVVHETSSALAILVANGSGVTRKDQPFVHLAGTTGGLVITRFRDRLQIDGDTGSTIRLHGAPVRETLVNGRPAETYGEPQGMVRIVHAQKGPTPC